MIQEAIQRALSHVHTSMPGIIVDFDPEKQTATIKPGFLRKYKNHDKPIALPDLFDVPVMFPRFGNASIHFPSSDVKNSSVLLVIAQRSLDNFLESGVPSDPQDNRRFSLTDAIAIGGIGTDKNILARNGDKDSLEISYGKAFIEISKDGKIKISNGQHDIISLFNEVIDSLLEAKTNTAMGPQPFLPATTLKLNEIKTKLESLVK